MSEQSDLDRRLRAVERALTDGDHDVAELRDAADVVDRLDDLEERIATLEERTDELDAATQAVRGYVGNVRSVNEEVESRADAALAAVDRIEARLDGDGTRSPDREWDPREPSGRTSPDARDDRSGEQIRSQEGRDPTLASRNGPAESPRGTDRSEASSASSRSDPVGGDGYGIEMQSTAAESTVRSPPPEDDAERSVIDRVREVL